jgi:hypothetical protein
MSVRGGFSVSTVDASAEAGTGATVRSESSNSNFSETGTARVKRGMAEMLKGGVIMDVVTPEQAKIAEDAGAVAVMALDRPDERPGHDRRHHRRRLDPGDGQGQDRPLR